MFYERLCATPIFQSIVTLFKFACHHYHHRETNVDLCQPTTSLSPHALYFGPFFTIQFKCVRCHCVPGFIHSLLTISIHALSTCNQLWSDFNFNFPKTCFISLNLSHDENSCLNFFALSSNFSWFSIEIQSKFLNAVCFVQSTDIF